MLLLSSPGCWGFYGLDSKSNELDDWGRGEGQWHRDTSQTQSIKSTITTRPISHVPNVTSAAFSLFWHIYLFLHHTVIHDLLVPVNSSLQFRFKCDVNWINGAISPFQFCYFHVVMTLFSRIWKNIHLWVQKELFIVSKNSFEGFS